MYSFIKNEPTVLDFCGVLCGGATCKQAALKVLVKQDMVIFLKKTEIQTTFLPPASSLKQYNQTVHHLGNTKKYYKTVFYEILQKYKEIWEKVLKTAEKKKLSISFKFVLY